ncbi:uncharacterized protein EV422DRAFT_502396 [Fimicolochytrium jonesii]|uniref:uncharacterized protein n=1 Tax=Fimicolochytrium jonesii TaxID=1396493 RepID=UPI0022FDD23B|nr:uncharacterized protein EV422DRAFT_502396 [Fimicolochytrium jonesii]KAI8826618.1 hypothetical protein EV422DRAFT_502396 [Fimicolochytrium jonesii]
METKTANAHKSKASLGPTQSLGKLAGGGKSQKRWAPLSVLLELGIIGICVVCLSIGNTGYLSLSTVPQTNGHWTLWSESSITFGYGIVVQIALLGPLQLGRKISQHWLASKIVSKGIKFRQMVTAWSVIYCNSHRGVEDIWRGWSAITFFMLVVYVAEVIVIEFLKEILVLGSSHVPLCQVPSTSLPLLGPYQSNRTTISAAPLVTRMAQKTILGLGQLYDPLTLSGLVIANGTGSACESTTCTAESSVILSPLTAPTAASESFGDHPWPAPWDTLGRNDRVVGEFSSLTADVSCSPKAFEVVADPQMCIDRSCYIYYTVNASGTSMFYNIYSLDTQFKVGTQVSLIALYAEEVGKYGRIATIDDRLYFGVLVNSLNGTEFANMNNGYSRIADAEAHPNTTVFFSFALCSAGFKIGREVATMEVVSVVPSLKASISGSRRSREPETYRISDDTGGYGLARYVYEVLTHITCDTLLCSIFENEVPWFDPLIGLLKVDAAGKAIVDPANQMQMISAAVARLLALSAASFTTNVIDPATTLPAVTTCEVYSDEISYDIYNARVMNGVLTVGLTCACVLLIWDPIMKIWTIFAKDETTAKKKAIVIGMTESIYVLLKGLAPSSTLYSLMPEMSESTPEDARKAIGGHLLELKSNNAGLTARLLDERQRNLKMTKELREEDGESGDAYHADRSA